MKRNKVIPVILCGGSGTRLWPLSRNSYPKQFLTLSGEHSLLQNTVTRALAIAKTNSENLMLLTLSDFSANIKEQLDAIHQTTSHIICEPEARNTAAALAYAAFYTKELFGEDALMWILPSDHAISAPKELGIAFHSAISAAELGYLVTFGIHPTKPETGYGYIRVDSEKIDAATHLVKEFVEKPNAEKAQQYVESGDFLWNSGMFLFKASSILAELKTHAATIYEFALAAFESAEHKGHPSLKKYLSIPKAPIDIAVMEKSDKVVVIPCDIGWSDVGSWESIWTISDKDINGNVIQGHVTEHDTTNSLILSLSDKPIACCGLDKIIVIDAGDVTLIAHRDNTQSIKFLTTELAARGLQHLLDKK